jgi:hypothetical protein
MIPDRWWLLKAVLLAGLVGAAVWFGLPRYQMLSAGALGNQFLVRMDTRTGEVRVFALREPGSYSRLSEFEWQELHRFRPN